MRSINEDLRLIVEGTASVVGEDFFRSLVQHLAQVLGVRYALAAEVLGAGRARALAFWTGEGFAEPFEYEVAVHPCSEVYEKGFCHYPDGVQAAFPEDTVLADLHAESYLGIVLLDPQGHALGHLAVLDDRPMQQEERRTPILKIFAARAGAELDRLGADRLREGLAQMLVHDLRNPLTAVAGYLELVEDGHVSGAAAVESVATARRSALRLIDMVSCLLDVAKLEAGQMPFQLGAVDLKVLVHEVREELRTLLDRRRLVLDLEADAALPPLHADRECLRRVLLNLVANAITFSPTGGRIRVAARTRDDRVEVCVADAGPGIPREEQHRLFTKFGQVGSDTGGRRQSTGLGLAFCKMAVEAQGGSIGVDSDRGRGSRFWFLLPQAAAPAAALAATA